MNKGQRRRLRHLALNSSSNSAQGAAIIATTGISRSAPSAKALSRPLKGCWLETTECANSTARVRKNTAIASNAIKPQTRKALPCHPFKRFIANHR